MFWRNTLCTYRCWWYVILCPCRWWLGRSTYVQVLLSKCQILNCIVRESNPGPPDRMWTLYHWAMESVHNMGVLVSWPPGRSQLLCNYSTLPPTSKHPYYSGGGEGESWQPPLPPPPIPAHIQLQGEPSNRQQHTTTHKYAQQQTTTHNNSRQQHSDT